MLIDSGKFESPKKLHSRIDDNIDWTVAIVDATETPIERPKKTKEATTVAKKTTHLKSSDYCALENRANTRCTNL